MAHELLAKPGTLTSNSVVEGAISYDKDASNILFVIKAAAVRISSAVDVVEVTGADDTERIYEQGQLAATQFEIQGYMVADSAVEINKLSNSNNDGNANSNCTLKFYAGNSRFINGPVVFRSIDLQWARNSPFVAVSMQGVFTAVDFTETTEER